MGEILQRVGFKTFSGTGTTWEQRRDEFNQEYGAANVATKCISCGGSGKVRSF